MIETLLFVALALLLGVIALLIVLLQRRPTTDFSPVNARLDAVDKAQERTERAVKEEIARNREEGSGQARGLREEMLATLNAFAVQLAGTAQTNEQKLEAMRLTLEAQLKSLVEDNGRRLEQIRQDATATARLNRDEGAAAMKSFNDSVVKIMGEMAMQQQARLEAFSAQLAKLTESNAKKFEELRAIVETRLAQIQADNTNKLEEMRRTVDEKLQGTLERRLGESFQLVSERLELVHKGLGEMQHLASGVGDLKKVLTNVKTRGTWGEMQLGNLLEQMLSPEQFAANVATKMGSNERVEFAIKLPGRDGPEGQVVWLPIDAKFPREDFERLVEASERADAPAVEEAGRQLELRVKNEARGIRDKYLDPPHTTDFAILFLPTEGLFAEVVRRPGLMDFLQREYRVSVAGPTTLTAQLNGLQMGFRTLAIQQRSSEVWAVLGAVKTEFGKFGEVIDRVQKKIQEASNVIDTAATRTRAIERKLRDVQELPAAEVTALLGESAAPSAVAGEQTVQPELQSSAGPDGG